MTTTAPATLIPTPSTTVRPLTLAEWVTRLRTDWATR